MGRRARPRPPRVDGKQTENDFFAPLATADTWIGADDLGGAFAGSTSTPFSFVNWQINEPNYPGVEHCMFMDIEAKCSRSRCTDLRPAYLCERSGAAP